RRCAGRPGAADHPLRRPGPGLHLAHRAPVREAVRLRLRPPRAGVRVVDQRRGRRMTIVDLFSRARDPQEDAADPTLSVFVTANAGSGKTKTLIDRVARLLLAKAKPETILCVTYTKAAASEMQRRLYERLGGWSVASDAVLRAELAKLRSRAPA